MTSKAEFNAEEWSQVLEGPPIAGMIVITAERGGTLRESLSMGKAYSEARKEHGGTELMEEILGSAPEVDREEFKSAEELQQRGLERLGESVRLLEQKATAEEIEAYKAFVVDVAQRVAEAHKSGGVLGIGGERVTDNEREALERVRAALDSPAPTAS